MPTLKKIVISNFRNIEFQEIEFSPNVNCICGDNGEGKTNLLDAIHYLSMAKSAITNSDKFLFRDGEKPFSLCGTYAMESKPDTKFAVQSSAAGEKKFKRDDKFYDRISHHIGVLPVVMIAPTDISLVSEAGDDRRKFINAVISQMDREYLSSVQQHNRLLNQRNQLLKDHGPNMDLIKVLGEMMSPLAKKIHDDRQKFVTDLNPAVKDYYKAISGGKEEISIEYKSQLNGNELSSLLDKALEHDMIVGFTTAGVHRDDLVFTMGGVPIRRFGSQGQQKSFLVALKFAQYEIMKRNYGFAPILLLDDVFDKLDMERISNLISMVAGNDFGQIFITDSNKVRLGGMVDSFTTDRAYFETVKGHFTKIE